MLTDKLQKALNAQINAELGSAYQYLAMAAHFDGANLEGSARWMRRQSREEVSHAMKIFEFVHDRDGKVVLEAVAKPKGQFASTLAVWEAVLKQEQHVTGLIHALYRLAGEEKDYPTQAMLQWFVGEQVEEEAAAQEILDKLRMVSDRPGSALYLDKEYGKRGK